MLAKTDIRNLLNDIENERVERTISTSNTDKFAQAVCAFANDIRNCNQPGYLFIGANDDGSLNGLKVTDELLRNLAGLRSDGNILPQPALMVYKENFPDGDVAVVEVQPSLMPPVRYKGKTWIRIGARKAVANEEEERILTEKRQFHISTFDTKPCFGATLDDLDIPLFQSEYLPKAISPEILKDDKRDVVQQLASLRLFDRNYNCPTNAGMLLLGHNPQPYIFGAYIQYVRFEGLNRAAKVVKENRFSGNLIQMLKELDSFVKYTIEAKRPVLVSALREEERINYPYIAIRELLMNSVMHRSYEGSNAPTKFYEYADRIEIDNPGNLYGKARIENFPNENDYRNPVVAEAMKTLGYVNKFGRGINMVQDVLTENGNTSAQFVLDDITTFKVVVWNAEYVAKTEDSKEDVSGDVTGNVTDVTDNVTDVTDNAHAYKDANDRRMRLVDIIRTNAKVSISELAKLAGVSRRTILRDIEILKTEDKLQRVGSEKAGHWIISE